MRLISHSGFVKLCTLNLSEAGCEFSSFDRVIFGSGFGCCFARERIYGLKNSKINMASWKCLEDYIDKIQTKLCLGRYLR